MDKKVMDFSGSQSFEEMKDAARVDAPKEISLVERTINIDVRYRIPGTRETRTFLIKSTIPDAQAKLSAARMESMMSGGLALPHSHALRISMLALVACQISEAGDLERWIKEDDDLLVALYKECDEHSLRYFRGDGGEGGEASREPNFSICSVVSPPA